MPDMKESLWMHACAGKDEFMQVAYWSRRVLPTVNDSKKKVDRMDLFTDRALYRKGADGVRVRCGLYAGRR